MNNNDNTAPTVDERAPGAKKMRAVADHFERRAYALRRALAQTGDDNPALAVELARLDSATVLIRDEIARLDAGDEAVAPQHAFTAPFTYQPSPHITWTGDAPGATTVSWDAGTMPPPDGEAS